MNKICIWGLCLFVAVMLGATLVTASEESGEMCVPMGTITLEPPETVEAKRAVVEFPHAVHFELSCKECHHMWETSEPVQSCSTSGCHDLDALPRIGDTKKVDKEASIKYYKEAFHKSCIGCHKKDKINIKNIEARKTSIEEELPSTGPTGCKECHPKEEL